MLQDGADALTFELPAVEDGEIRQLSLADYVGEQIVVLAFYPGDFNPACEADSDLAALDLFAMQPDVAVVAVGPDTVYSHRAFAAEYDLDIPLCADTRGEVAAAYEVAFEDDHGQRRPERAVFVVDLDGVIRYAWSTRDPYERPNDEAIQRAVADIGGDAAAVSRYRVGHAHYVEGRRAFTSAMSGFEEQDWMVARSDFERAREEFTTAAEQFATSGRFVEAAQLDEHFERARMKATALWQAADWLAEAADAISSGDGEEGQAYRRDAESPLETARELAEPLNPDDIIVTDDGVEIPDDAIEQADESVMDAIREQTEDGSVAGGVDLDLGEATVDLDDEDDEQPADEGPDTDAARRLREYAGVGVDIDEPDGAEDDQIADALADADAPAGERDERETAERESPATGPDTVDSIDDVPDTDESTSDPIVRGGQSTSSADNSDSEASAGDHDSTAAQTGEEAADITDEEIEEIAEELQAVDDESAESESGTGKSDTEDESTTERDEATGGSESDTPP